jgi:predicted metal-dependent hydrolase
MSIPIDHLIHSRRKTVALIVKRDGTLTVRAPLRMPETAIRAFVQSHAGWILEKQAQAKAAPPPPQKRYADGETFLYQGKEYPLTIVPSQRPAVVLERAAFRLTRSALPKAQAAFTRWYKQQALVVLTARVETLAKQFGFRYGKIRISSARTRWGSCSSNGTLSFTWRLVMAPPEVIDYVVMHELVHTQVRNHSPKFWNRLSGVMPDYKRHVAWLKKNGRLLTLGEA